MCWYNTVGSFPWARVIRSLFVCKRMYAWFIISGKKQSKVGRNGCKSKCPSTWNLSWTIPGESCETMADVESAFALSFIFCDLCFLEYNPMSKCFWRVAFFSWERFELRFWKVNSQPPIRQNNGNHQCDKKWQEVKLHTKAIQASSMN